MYVLKVYMTADELNAKVKNNISEEEQKRFENTNFAVFDVRKDENMGVELTMVAVAEDIHLDAINTTDSTVEDDVDPMKESGESDE